MIKQKQNIVYYELCVYFTGTGDLNWVQCNQTDVPAVNYTVKELVKGNLYEFRVSAENRAGVGPASKPTQTRAHTPVGAHRDLSYNYNIRTYSIFLVYFGVCQGNTRKKLMLGITF